MGREGRWSVMPREYGLQKIKDGLGSAQPHRSPRPLRMRRRKRGTLFSLPPSITLGTLRMSLAQDPSLAHLLRVLRFPIFSQCQGQIPI